MKNPLKTYAEYLEAERTSDHKHEFLRGDVWAMSGGTPEHGRLASQLAFLLLSALKGRPCVVYSSDVRVRIAATDRSTYPDLSVVCGPERRATDDPDAITNPVVLVEVLSPTTERSDRGEKFAHYQRLETLKEYVLVSTDLPRVEVFHRRPEGWFLTIHESGDVVRLDALDLSFEVSSVFADPRT